MKTCLLLGLLFLSGLACLPQTSNIKLYGFKQAVLKGVPPSYEKDEKGKTVETKNESHSNLFIYLSYPPAEKLQLAELWINGEQYNFKEETVHPPIQITYDNGVFQPEQITLVPQTSDTVVRILVKERTYAKKNIVKKSLAEANDIVVGYKLNEKLYWQTLKKIKSLRAAAMQ